MDYQKLALEKEDGYVVAAIINPPANALSQAALGELNSLLDKCIEDSEVRAHRGSRCNG